MLVVARQKNERIFLSFEEMTADELLALRGQTIQITLVEIRGWEKARIGVEAPECVRVDREELYRVIQREKAMGAMKGDGYVPGKVGGVRPGVGDGVRGSGAVDAVGKR
jgi:carbon storage regulator CsrA